MPLEAPDIVNLLTEVHIPNLNEAEVQVLSAALAGWKPVEIGERVFLSDREVRRMLERLVDTICRPAGTHHALGPVALWAVAHQSCRFRCSAAICEKLRFGASNTSTT